MPPGSIERHKRRKKDVREPANRQLGDWRLNDSSFALASDVFDQGGDRENHEHQNQYHDDTPYAPTPAHGHTISKFASHFVLLMCQDQLPWFCIMAPFSWLAPMSVPAP